MIALYLIGSVASLWLSVVNCRGINNHTVTEEVYFDVEIKDYEGPGDDYRGRFVVGVFGDTTPMTAMNFVAIAKGYKRGRDKLHYKNTYIHRVIRDFIIQMGDVTDSDGTGSESIYGDKFIDENFILSHKAAGYVSMANHGKDTNGSQFVITLGRTRWLDGIHVVFGKVIKGMDVIKVIGELTTNKSTNEPKNIIKVTASGVLEIAKKYTLTEEQQLSEEDIDKDNINEL